MKAKWMAAVLTGCLMINSCRLPVMAQEIWEIPSGEYQEMVIDSACALEELKNADDRDLLISREDLQALENLPEDMWDEVFFVAGGRGIDALGAVSTVSLDYSSSMIEQSGPQAKGQCMAYALAYCRTILDGRVHYGSEYWDGSLTQYSWAGYTRGGASTKQGTLAIVYNEINAGRPIVLYVTGNYRGGWNAYSDHWVTVVGYKASASPNNLTESDFLCIDPSGCALAFLNDDCGVYRSGFDNVRISATGGSVSVSGKGQAPVADSGTSGSGNTGTSGVSGTGNGGSSSGGSDDGYYVDTDVYYTDVKETSGWRHDAVWYVTDHGIMNGVGNHRFSPDTNITRAMFATIVYRMAGSPSLTFGFVFPDVPAGNYYSIPVVWANRNGIIKGHSDTGYFGTDENITREDLVVIMYRYACSAGKNVGNKVSLSSYKDASKVSKYAVDAMQWAVGNGIITGRSNTGLLDPKGNATRVEAAAIIQRFMTKL